MPNIFKSKEEGVAVMLDHLGNQVDLVHDPVIALRNIQGSQVYIQKNGRQLKISMQVPESLELFHWEFDVVGGQVNRKTLCQFGGEATHVAELAADVRVALNGRL